MLLTCNEYLDKIGLPWGVLKLPLIAIPHDDAPVRISFMMKDLETDQMCWWQDRMVNPGEWRLKSKTRKWSKVGWFYTNYDITKPLILAEWEKDFLTAWRLWWNVIGIQWVNNLAKTVEILSKKWAQKIIVLVDNDEAANKAIEKIQNRKICYDWRYVLWNVKDINDAHLDGCLEEPSALPSQNLFVKLWAFKIKKSTRPLPDKSIDFLSIDTAMILQNLYPQYQVRGDRIYENWKLLDGYRFWKSKNAIVDFSGKERPQGNAWSVAYSYYNDKKETVDYLKRYV